MLDTAEILETCERLKIYPNLLEKVKDMLDLIERKKVKSVDDFEEALIPEVRQLGKEIMETWGGLEEEMVREQLENNNKTHHSKKNYIGIQPLEK